MGAPAAVSTGAGWLRKTRAFQVRGSPSVCRVVPDWGDACGASMRLLMKSLPLVVGGQGNGFHVWRLKDLWQKPRAPLEAARASSPRLRVPSSPPRPPAFQALDSPSLMASAPRGRPGRRCEGLAWGIPAVASSPRPLEPLFSPMLVVFRPGPRRRCSASAPVSSRSGLRPPLLLLSLARSRFPHPSGWR